MDIARAIAAELKPWREPYTRAQVIGGVREAAETLRATAPQFFLRSAIQTTRSDAKALVADIDRIERRISRASPELRMRLKLTAYSANEHPLLAWISTERN